MIAVSECLAGASCRYDGGSKADEEVRALVREGKAICICPELLGGLGCPRPPAEIVGGDGYDVLQGRARVMDASGRDVTEQFIAGAEAAVEICRAKGIRQAILKERSPSCGVCSIYDGKFSGCTKPGMGVSAAMLESRGIQVRGV